MAGIGYKNQLVSMGKNDFISHRDRLEARTGVGKLLRLLIGLHNPLNFAQYIYRQVESSGGGEQNPFS